MKRYLITGASRGIGRAIAEKLAGPDVELLLHGRDAVALAEVCKTVKHHCAHVVRLIHDLDCQDRAVVVLWKGQH
jgi:short-subunit dehydrogenase